LNLGAPLFAQNKLDEAIACFRQALAIAPEHDAAHNNLGAALRQQGKLDEAIGEFRKTIDINPNHAMAWCNLGHTLQQQGSCREALAALRRGHELGSQQKDWSYPSAEWVRDSERRAALDEKLPAILRGEVAAADAQENLTLAELSMIPRKFYA